MYVCGTLQKDQLCVQLSIASATVFVEKDQDNPLLTIVGGSPAGMLLTASKLGHSPASGEFVIEEIVACLDPSLQELLDLSITSCVLAAKAFVYECPSDFLHTATLVGSSADRLEVIEEEQQWLTFDIAVKSITGKAGRVCLRAQHTQLALSPRSPIVGEVQEISVVANGATLVYLCSIAVTSVVSSDDIRIEVATSSANISANVEGFESVMLLLRSITQRWSSRAKSSVADVQTRRSVIAGQNLISKNERFLVSLALRFEFIEYGVLALEGFSIGATVGDGWHIHLSAAGCTTEGWCHSVPPRPQDPFIDIDLWANAFLAHSPFAGGIEDDGIAFRCSLNHVTLCLGDDLISSLESLYDTVMVVLFKDEDHHVYLSERDKYTIPSIAGFFTGSHMLLLLESNGGELALLPGCADTAGAAATGSAGSANVCGRGMDRPPPPPPLTVEFLGEECLRASFHRYGDKRLDINIVFQEGLNAYLIGTPAHIPLLVSRGSMRAELDLHLSAPSVADLPVFPYRKLNFTMNLSNVAFVTHIPTLLAAWSHFSTPSLPLCRLRNIGSRIHFSSRLSRPDAMLAPRSPVSASVEAVGSAAFARISRAPGGEVRGTAESMPTLAPCATYSTPVFPSDMRLCVEVTDSELYYPWGEGSVAPLYLHAEVPRGKVVMLNRDECFEVTVRGLLAMPRVAAALHTFSPAMDEAPAPPPSMSQQHSARAADAGASCVLLEHLTNAAADGEGIAHFSCTQSSGSAAQQKSHRTCAGQSSGATQAAFPGKEPFAASQSDPSQLTASSLIQVHVVYTMDSRPPFWPGNSDESLRVSLTPDAMTGSGALPGPLCVRLGSPAEVASWLTFFTFFNPTNTVPLTTSNPSAAASPAFVSEGEDNGGGGQGSTSKATAQSLRRLIMSVHTAPIVVHVPFAGVAAVLWNGVEFVASPGYRALRIPKLDVLVHEELQCASKAGVATSVQRLATLRDSGYAVVSFCSSGGTGEVGTVPAILLESYSTGPTAVEVRRRVVLPGVVGKLSDSTIVQLQQCATLAAVSAVVAARGVQTTLLNAVILHESQRQRLRYACCSTTFASSGTDVDAQAQLMAFLSPPLAIHMYKGCLTFEWASKLQRGLRAGVTVALENARFNDYGAYRYPSADQLTHNDGSTTAHFPRCFLLPELTPLLVEVEAVEAYVWWTTAAYTNAADSPVSEEVISIEGLSTSEQNSNVPLVTACMPLLLFPLQVRTHIDETALVVDEGAGDTAGDTGTAATAVLGTHLALDRKEDECVAAGEEPAMNFSMAGDNDTIGEFTHLSELHPIASTYTMPSTTSDSKSSLSATAAPSTTLSPERGTEALPTPVFEVTPVHVVFNTTVYAVLRERLLYHTHGTGAVTAAGDARAMAMSNPPASQSLSRFHQYYLTHRVVELSTAARHGLATSSLSAASPLSPMICSRSGLSSNHSSPGRGFGVSLDRHASSLERAQAVRVETVYTYRYDGTFHPRVWVEKSPLTSWQLQQQPPPQQQQMSGDISARKETKRARDPFLGDTREITKGEQRIMPVGFIPPSTLPTVNDMPLLPTLPGSGPPVELRMRGVHDSRAKLPSPATMPEEVLAEHPESLRSSAQFATVVPRVAPQATMKPRLQMRMAVAEVCMRLVHYRDVETTATAASEARHFWQRYAVVHAAARRAGAESPASVTTARRCCLITFLAVAVPPLRILSSGGKQDLTNSRGISPSLGNRTRFHLGQLPALSTSAEQRRLAPTAMLEEACVDALCVRLTGLIVSGFNDARSVQLETCVCTSVKSSRRPLFSMAHAEVYVPSTSVTYPSAAEAAKTVARDLQGAAWTADVVRGVGPASEGASVSVSSMMSRQGVRASVAASAPSRPPPQSPGPTGHVESPHWAGLKPPATCPMVAPTGTDARGCNADGVPGQSVVMQNEVRCRVETLTVDLSASALRAWLSCLVEHPVDVMLDAAEEEENLLESVANVPRSASTLPTSTAPAEESVEAAAGAAAPLLSPLQWKPGQGLRVHEVRGAFWGLEHDITLSRDGLVLVFSSQDTNLLTVHLNGNNITIDSSLLLRPAGLQRVVMVVQGGLTVRFVGSGCVRLPLALWRTSLVETTANVDVETVLLPFMAIGEGSYLECSQVRLGFTEPAVESSVGGGNSGALAASIQRPGLDFSGFPSKPSAVIETAERGNRATVGTPSLQNPSPYVDVHPSQLVHYNLHLHLPHISIILEPRHEFRQFHICTAAESCTSLCDGRLLRNEVRCTGLTVLSEPVHDSAMTTARTTVLAPVNVEVCSNNRRHHAVSLGATQVDLGRADLLIMSTYAGELQTLQMHIKHLTHGKAETEFLGIVEATLAWKASSVATNNTGRHGEEEGLQDGELPDDQGDAGDTSEGGEEERVKQSFNHGASGCSEEQTEGVVPPSRSDYAQVNCPNAASGAVESTAAAAPGGEKGISRRSALSAGPSIGGYRKSSYSVTPQGSAKPGAGLAEGLLDWIPVEGRGAQEDACSSIGEGDGPMPPMPPPLDARWQQQQQQRRRQRLRLLRQQQSRGFSWAVFTPSVEVILSDHRHPLLQVGVQDVVVRRTSTSALASTSLLQCQRGSVQVHGRGRWDVLLEPSAAVTLSLTQTVSRHSSNQHVSLVVEGVHWHCSHLIVAKLLYVNQQLSALATSLTRRLSMAATAGGGASTGVPPAPIADVVLSSDVNGGRGEEEVSEGDGGGGTAVWRTSVSPYTGGDSATKSYERSGNSSHQRSSSVETFSDTSSPRPRRHAVAMGAPEPCNDTALTTLVTASALPFPAAAAAAAVVGTRAPTGVPFPTTTTTSDILTGSLPLSYRGGSRRLRATAGAELPARASTISPSMATHRLLNSFSHTLFAGICQPEGVEKVPPAAASGVLTAASSSRTESATTIPMLWRCKELYRMLPSSSTDIFISYRRAHSLMLTFFTTECVEWDEVNGAWALNAKGETALAARATSGASRLTTHVSSPVSHRQQQHLRGPRDAPVFPSIGSASATATNWFAFTSLQYGMAQPLTIYTAVPREKEATAGPSPAPKTTSTPYLYNDTDTRTSLPRMAAPFPISMATGITGYDGGRGCGGGSYSPVHSLVLTCVDTEEAADTSRYPIVVSNRGGDDDGSTADPHQQQRRRCARRGSFTALSEDKPAPLSCSAPSAYVDSLAEDGTPQGDRTPKDSVLQTEQQCSTGGTSVNHCDHGDISPGEYGGLPLLTSLPAHLSPTSSHSQLDSRHRGNVPTPPTAQNPRPSTWWTGQSHNYNTTRAIPAAHQRRPKPPPRGLAATTPVASKQATWGSGEDLLVVRLQARSSLLNKTGCTLQLFSHDVLPAYNSVSEASSLPATSTTVPPGWQLPLNEEVMHKEVVLRVCCPSTRCAPFPGEPSTAVGGSRDPGSVLEATNKATTPLRWFETRIVLGQLEGGRFLSCRPVDVISGASDPPADVPGAVTAKDSAGLSHHRATGSHVCDDHDERLLLLFVMQTYSADGLVQHLSLYPRLTLLNQLGLTARVVVFQQDPLAGPQTPDEALLITPWMAPVGHARRDRKRFYRSLVSLGAHDALPHLHALPLHLCTYDSNLVLGLSFTQSTGDSFFTADLDPVITHLREAVDGHPRLLQLRDSHGRAFHVQVSVMPRTVVLSVALWVYNLTEYPLLMSHGVVRRRLCPGQSSTSGIIPSQGEPFLIGCQLTDFTQCFFAIGMDGGWSSAVTIDVASSGVLVSPLPRLGISRSCNYSILFPNAQEGRPMVIQITPRWVFYNNTSKRLRLHFHFPGLEKAMWQAEKQRRQPLTMRDASTTATANGSDAASMSVSAAEADDTVSALASIAAVQLNPGDYHVSSIGPIEGNQLRVQEVLEGTVPTVTSITSAYQSEHCDVTTYYESQPTPCMDIDHPGEATFNLWAAPRAPGKHMAVSYGGDFLAQRPPTPHPTGLEPFDMYATDAVVTGHIALSVQSASNVLAVLLLPIQETKILLQNRTESHTVMVRQQGCRRQNRIPPRQNRFFLWEDVREEHAIRVHILGYKGRWFDVDFSAGECKVTRHVNTEAAAAAEAVEQARQLHPHPSKVKLQAELHGKVRAAAEFPFHVRGYTNAEKTRVTILVTEFPVPVYAAIDSWRTSQVLSLRMTMVQLTWIQERSAYMVADANSAAPFVMGAAGDGAVEGDASREATAPAEGIGRGGGEAHVSPHGCFLRHRGSTARAAVAGTSPSNVANAALFTIILEGVQLERLATEDNENFYFAVHQMQWVDGRRRTVFVYRARPRLPAATTLHSAADATHGEVGASVSMPDPSLLSRTSAPSSSTPFLSHARRNVSEHTDGSTRRLQAHDADSSPRVLASASSKRDDTRSGGYTALLAPITAASNRLVSTALGRSDAFLLSMEKKNDLELSYNLIKYADGVMRYTELRCVLTPLVVELTDFWLVDMIQEVRRLRVLLGLQEQMAASQSTTTAPLVLTASSLWQQSQHQQQRRSRWRSPGGGDTDCTLMVVVPGEDSIAHRIARATSRQLGQRKASVALMDGDTHAEVLHSEQLISAAREAPQHRSPSKSICSEERDPWCCERQPGSLRRSSGCDTGSDSDASSTTTRNVGRPARTGGNEAHKDQTNERGNAKHCLVTGTRLTQRPSNPSRASAPTVTVAAPAQQQQQQRGGNAAGFLSQTLFLQQLVQGVRTRLEQREAGVMAGSLVAPTTRGANRKRSTSGQPSLLPGDITSEGLDTQRQQLIVGATSAAVPHRWGAARRGGSGDGLVGVTNVDTGGSRAVVDVGSSSAGAADDDGAGGFICRSASARRAARSVKSASFMFIERLEVQRVTLYVTFVRHSPDPLRPLLGAYAWMLPSHLRQRDFHLPAWTLTRQVETPASLRARLMRWGMHSLREQWTKVTKLGTLLDALRFWQHRTLPLHGAPRVLTLSRLQRQKRGGGGGGGKPSLATFAPCVSSGGEESDYSTDGDNDSADAPCGGARVERPASLPADSVMERVRRS
ncbi:hypothetical protein JKF63_06873 [Porcisia hertigi]|uniref:Uncharacterized protein n=1 Tax=Porcisia hertigi TaxID=2761500 RepID=A0A836LJA5_9TRYP|nr:hypothetical protein JKF63_06873 [Porcisia hertigi]